MLEPLAPNLSELWTAYLIWPKCWHQKKSKDNTQLSRFCTSKSIHLSFFIIPSLPVIHYFSAVKLVVCWVVWGQGFAEEGQLSMKRWYYLPECALRSVQDGCPAHSTVLKHRNKSCWCLGVFRFPAAWMEKGWALQDSEALEKHLYSELFSLIKGAAPNKSSQYGHVVCLCCCADWVTPSLGFLPKSSHIQSFCAAPTRHDFFWLRLAVAFLQQMLCRLI